MTKQAKFFREKAREIRALAERSSSETLRTELERVAAEYDRLAIAADEEK